MTRAVRGVRWRSVMLVAALATLLAGCAAPSLPPLPWQARGHVPLPDAQQIMRVSLPGGQIDGHIFDPIHEVGTNLAGSLMMPLLYSGLFTMDTHLRPVPALASGYSVSADGLRYTFHLRSGARFSDGAAITSSDAAFSLDRAAGPCDSYVSFDFGALKDAPRYAQQRCAVNLHTPPAISAGPSGQPIISTLVGDALLTPDPHTLTIVLSRPDAALLDKLAEPYSGIVERSIVLRYGGYWTQHLADQGGQGTSGMYMPSAPMSDGANGQRITLTRAKTYWGAQPRLREVVIDLRAPDQLTSGDVVFDGPGGFKQQTTGGPLKWRQAPARYEYYLTLDPAAPGLSDLRLRQALALALDKTALAADIGGQATNHLVPPGTGAYPATLSGPIATAPLTGNEAQARTLWQSYVRERCSGDASRCPPVTLYLGDWLLHPQVGQLAVSARWTSVLPGLRVTVTDPPDVLMTAPWYPWSAATTFSWYEDYPDPQDWLSAFVQEPQSSPPTPIHDSAVDALVARAEAAPDPASRLALYQQAENMLLNDALVIPIAQAQVTWGVTRAVANFPADPAPWIPPAAWARIYLTAQSR